MVPSGPGSAKLALVMVGLPARGKTYVARKLQRYLSWLGYATMWVNAGDYRRARAGAKMPADYFAPDNDKGYEQRLVFARAALDDLLAWFREGSSEGQVGIYDATNTERLRRDMIYKACREEGIQVLFIESICEDESIIERNVRNNKLLSPDYEGMDPDDAYADFRKRIAHYESKYEPVEADDRSYVKIIDEGRQVVVNRVEGYLQARLMFFLMNIHPAERPIWLTRHGESTFNVLGKLGGNPDLTERGLAYGKALAEFIAARNAGEDVTVWTSTLRRTIQTSDVIDAPATRWRALDEINAGVCEGMTYEEVKAQMPEEFAERNDNKFLYRYPHGESYLDVIHRLEHAIHELERQRSPVLVITHQAVIRALYAYLMGKPQQECPHLDIPLHTVVELIPHESGYEEHRYVLTTGATDRASA